MSLTITPSPFGSLTVSVAETNSTLSVTTVATSPAVLSMALGVPGPQGETGSQGPAGSNGVGVPTGGSAGQVLAKIDGTNYNTEWVNAATGNFLPLSGGTMSAGALIDFTVTSGNDSEIGAWGFGVENTSGQVSYIEPQEIRIYDGTSTTGTRLIASGVQFNDSTTQVTAGLPLSGGSLFGDLVIGNNSLFLDETEHLGASFRTENGSGILEMSGAGIAIYNPNYDAQVILSNGLYLYGTSAIIFPDSTTQTTAFPGYTGTTSQYIDGTGALQTFPTVTTAGKMVTSFRNNTGATLAKGTVVYINGQVGNKPTVAKAQANTEATSKATYGFVETAVANNTDGNIVILGLLENIDTQGYSDGDLLYLSPTTAGAWTKTQPFSPYHYVRVGTVIRGGHPTLGSIAVQVTNGFQLDEMSDVGATAPSNANVLTWDSTASQWLDKSISTILGYTPLSSTTASATYQTISGMSAYLSTSAAANTYQTQSGMSAYLSTASAVANYLSTSAYATTAQAQAGTSGSTVISPSTLLDAKSFAGYKPLSMIYTWTSATSGTGASTTVSGQVKNVFAPTSATGYAQAYVFNYNATRGSAGAIGADFSKRTTIGGRFIKTVTTADANSVFRFLLGKFVPTPPAGDLSARGIGFRQVANGALELQVHNGTTLYNVTSTFTPTANQSYDLTIVSDGAGNATMYVNGSSVATSANAPTAILTTNLGILEIEAQNTATLSGSAMSYSCSDMFVQTNL